MSHATGYINTPPGSEFERRIVKGILLYNGLNASEASVDKGVTMAPYRPEDYVFETKGPGIIAGLSICIFVIAGMTGLRLGLRYFNPRLRWGLDDTLMIFGLIMAVAYPSLQIAMVVYGGAGKHIYDVKYTEYYIYKWLANVASIDFFVCVGIVKMSITSFNVRVTSMTSTKWRTLNWVFFALCGIYTISAFFLNVFQCNPAGASFDLLLVADSDIVPHCEGVSKMGTILRTINFVLDWCLVLIPVGVLWSVKMTWLKKITLILTMCIGSLACIASVLTLIAKEHLKSDALWNYTGILGWSLAEITIGTTAASLPTLAFLLPSGKKRSTSYPQRLETGSAYAPAPSNTGVKSFHSNKVSRSRSTRAASSQERLAAEEDCSIGIVRTVEIELESRKRPSSGFGSEDNIVTTYGPSEEAIFTRHRGV